jgi:predicted site-specific integrase-resolvase
MDEDKYIKPKEATRLTGLNNTTLRRMGDSGEIPCIKTNSGRYLYNISRFVGPRNPVIPEKTKICYARVSGRGQKTDLQNQIKFLQEKYPTHQIISDYGSGLNYHRNGLKEIMDLAFKNQLGEVVVTYKDRLCRFGFELFEYIFKKQSNATIVVLCKTITSPEAELSTDLLSIITVFSARMHGLRKYKSQIKKDTTIPDEGISSDDEEADREPSISV